MITQQYLTLSIAGIGVSLVYNDASLTEKLYRQNSKWL